MGIPTAAYIADQKTLHGGSLVIPSARDGVADDSQLFKSAMIRARDARTSIPGASHIVNPSPKVIPLRPGIYTVRQALALMGAEGLSAQTRGLHLKGSSSGTTTIVFDPAEPGVMCRAEWWQNVRFSGITFALTDRAAGSVFLEVVNGSDANAGQDYIFRDVSWTGPWRYLVDLQGVNNASEMRFDACEAIGLQDGGAWLHIGDAGSDQMLNYWFHNIKLWSTSASLCDVTRGGSIHIDGLDASDWGKSGNGVLFALRGHTHARGVTTFRAAGVRVENKSDTSKILYSDWDFGSISLQVDMGSQAEVQTYGTMIEINAHNADHASVSIHDSVMAGKIKVTTGAGAPGHAYNIVVEDSLWLQAKRPSDVIVHDLGGMSELGAPVRFSRCRPEGYSDPMSPAGYSVWDDVVIGRGQQGSVTHERLVRLVDVWGGLAQGPTATVNLPRGSLVTGFWVLSPTGSQDDADGGTYTLAMADGTVIATATIPGATSAGYSIGAALPVPVLCSTDAAATLKVSTTDIASVPRDALVLLRIL